jgi:hypothetical protein
MATIVTFRHTAVKNGVIGRNELLALWKGEGFYEESAIETLIRLLMNLDILVPLDKERSLILVPCLLPDRKPVTLAFNSDANGVTLRRSYLLNGNAVYFPVGVIGKLISSFTRWGDMTAVWRSGCIVEMEDAKAAIFLKSIGDKEGLHLVLSTQPSRFDLAKEAGKERHWFSQKGVGLVVNGLCIIFQKVHHVIRSILFEFYQVQCEEVVPIDDMCDDWCPMKRVRQAIRSGKAEVQTEKNAMARLDVLCPDEQFFHLIHHIPRGRITLLDVLGEGAGGRVFRANLKKMIGLSRSRGDHDLDSEVVAVKIANIAEGSSERECDLVWAAVRHEIFFTAYVRHPNVIRLRGIVVEEHPPWLVLEMGEGGDLLSNLVDPFGIIGAIQKFLKVFHLLLSKKIFDDLAEFQRPFSDIFINELQTFHHLQMRHCPHFSKDCLFSKDDALRRELLKEKELGKQEECERPRASMYALNDVFENLASLLSCAEDYWVQTTCDSNRLFEIAIDKV